MFKGSIVALITPFRGGKVDEKAFQDLVDWQIREGTHGLVPCGTTGESPTLSHDEQKRVIDLCIEAAAGRVPVIAGTGSNNTETAIEFATHARKVGATAQLVVTPYYNKPNQEGMYRHFKALHDATDLPILIYNIPPRSVVDMSVETMARLANLPNIVGVKDATMDLARVLQTRVAIGPDFCILSGEDATALALNAQGGDGCISVTANVAPKACSDMQVAWQDGDFATARQLNEMLIPLHDSLFAEPNPGPVKYAASLLGLCTDEVRLPLCETGPATRARVEEAMTAAGLLPAAKAAVGG